MSKTRILLSYKETSEYYLKAVQDAGAEGTAFYLSEVDTSYDGLILTGGGDIDPSLYQEEKDGSVRIDKDRDATELALIKAYMDAGKPILGICRGHQLLNVYFGGSLYQHLPETPQHTNKSECYITHEVSALQDSVLGKLYGTSFVTNSSHHQAVKRLGEGLRPTAFWNGQYVEAFEHETLPILGVQWHPEKMRSGIGQAETSDGLLLIKHFVEMCKK